MGIIKVFKGFIDKMDRQEELKNQEYKDKVIYDITKEWSIEEIRDYNTELLVLNSNRYSGSYNEQEIKMCLLSQNHFLFTDEEYVKYYNVINPDKAKVLSKLKV